VKVGVTVGVLVKVGVIVGLFVAVGEIVGVRVDVGVAVPVGVRVAVRVGEAVGVLVAHRLGASLQSASPPSKPNVQPAAHVLALQSDEPPGIGTPQSTPEQVQTQQPAASARSVGTASSAARTTANENAASWRGLMSRSIPRLFG
jgi:hypothetical protein